MKLESLRASRLVGDQTGIHNLLQDVKDESIELDAFDAAASAAAVERLPLVSSITMVIDT